MELFHYQSVSIAQTVFCEGKVVILDGYVLGVMCQALTSLNIRSLGNATTRSSMGELCYMQRMQCHILIIANYTDIIVLGISFSSDIGDDKMGVLFGI